MANEETPVTSQDTPATGADAFTAARASLSQSTDQVETPVSDDTSPTKPAEDPEKPADQPSLTGDDTDALLTPEELAALPPKERAKAEKWQAKLTQKAQALAAQGKEFDEWKSVVDGLKTNPKETVQKIAEQIGLKIAADKQDTTTVEQKTAEVMAELPEEWQFLKPVFDKFGKQLLDSVKGELAPIKEATDSFIAEATETETKTTLKVFSDAHPGWEKHEKAMLDVMGKFVPAKGKMTDLEYMEFAYKAVTADLSEADKTKKVVEKINKAVSSSEPNTSGVTSSRVVHALPPPEKRSMRDAFEAAKRGEVWQK